jgi:t-SNARE complex subunit (syntaxin)
MRTKNRGRIYRGEAQRMKRKTNTRRIIVWIIITVALITLLYPVFVN